MKQLLLLVPALLTMAGCVTTGEIQHRFVATDESGKQLLYVDETNPANDWTVPLPGNRDIQLSGKGTVLVSVPVGYREYDLKDGNVVWTWYNPDRAGTLHGIEIIE